MWRRCKMKSLGLLMVLLCVMAVFAKGQDASDSATKSKVVALEGAWNQAYKSGDAKALDTLLDNGIVLVNDDGSMQTKTEFLASVKPSGTQAASQEQQVAPESLSVRVFGNTAIATGIFRAKGVAVGQSLFGAVGLFRLSLGKNTQGVCRADAAHSASLQDLVRVLCR